MAEFTDREVDERLGALLLGEDPILDSVLRTSEDEGLPAITVSALQGKLLEQLVRMTRATRVLEIGTLGGYSAVHLARGLPHDGELITLEIDPHHGEVARLNLERAGVAARSTVLIGPGVESLDRMIAEGTAPFDLVFIDADKASYPLYLERSMPLCRPGSVIVFDNMVREGRILEEDPQDAAIEGTKLALEFIAADHRLDATAIQTVGAKGWDGFVLALVREH